MICFTTIVWWLDRYEREPMMLVLLMFLVGALGVPVIVMVFHLILITPLYWFFSSAVTVVISAVLLAPVIEEGMKALPFLFLRRNSNFDNGTDGIVYGSAIGFGFGMTENVIYFVGAYFQDGVGALFWTIIIRTLFSATLHAFTTGMVGYFFGRVKFNRKRPVLNLALGFTFALMLHIIWNSVITYAELVEKPQLILIMLGLFPVVFVALIILMQQSLHEESVIIRNELAEEALFGVIPSKFVNIIPYYLKRCSKGWVNESVKKKVVDVATYLAFKKHCFRICTRGEKEVMLMEIDKLRQTLRELMKFNLE